MLQSFGIQVTTFIKIEVGMNHHHQLFKFKPMSNITATQDQSMKRLFEL